MTSADIQAYLDRIAVYAGDGEAQHSIEDELYYKFAQYVAQEAPEPFAALANQVLLTKELAFARWGV